MRLDFNILWVEDQPNEVKAQRDRIDFLLRKQGFRVNAEFARSVDEAENFLGDDIYRDHIDLILMDLDLGDGPNGSAGIEMVRDAFPFKDIIFYSASGVQKLKDALTSDNLQGLFFSTRNDLADTVYGTFMVLVKKVLDIDHSRGIVMGITSEIDHFVNTAFGVVFSQANDELKRKAQEIVSKQVAENQKSINKEIEKIKALGDNLTSIGEFHLIYTSKHRLRLLRKILEAAGTHESERKLMLDYAEKTMPLRDRLAHVNVIRNGFSRKLLDREGNEITTDVMQGLRVTLLECHECFEKIVGSLGSQKEEER